MPVHTPHLDAQSPLSGAHALSRLRAGQKLGVLAIVLLAGLLCGAVFMVAYYPAIFHSDSAAHQLLAQAMVDERSLLPRDFAYGNQLILWRNNLFIAPLLALGVEGYRAYAGGSAINFAVFLTLAFVCLDQLLGDWRRSLLVALLFFLPWGHSEADFVMGQQSHLAFVAFALVLAVNAYRAAQGARGAVFTCSVVVFLLVLEAPTRTAMLLLPLAAALWLAVPASRLRGLAVAVIGGAAIAYLANRWLVATHQVTGIPPLPMAPFPRFVARGAELTRGLVDYFIGFEQFERTSSNPATLVLYAFKTLLLAAFAGMLAWQGWRVAMHLRMRLAAHLERVNAAGATPGARERRGDMAAGDTVPAFDFLGIAAVFGIAIGFWIVCAIEYWLDVRHFLWALMFLKLLLIVGVLQGLDRHVRVSTARVAVALVAGVLVSSTATNLLVPQYRHRLQGEIATHYEKPMIRRVQAQMQATGLNRLYGRHWEVLRLEVLAPPARTASLAVDRDQVQFVAFLSRPSMRCVQGDVLYLLDKGVPEEAFTLDKVLAAGGRLLEQLTPGKALYRGRPVWNTEGCS